MAISSRNDNAKANSIDAEVNVSFKPGDENDGDAAESEKSVSPAAAYFRLWYFASPLDNVLRCIAATAAVAGGTTEPLMAIIFGNLVNVFNGNPPLSPHDFRSEVNKNTLYFVYLFVGKFCCIYVAATLFNITSARMASNIRLRYLSKVLHQPIEYFDKHSPGSISTSLTNDTNVVQVGLSEKLGIVFQALSMMVTSFIIAFIKGWKLTLVTATILPYLVITTGYLGGRSAQIESQITQTLNQASGVAEEALSSILNITALGAVEKILHRFDSHVNDAMKVFTRFGILQSLMWGNMYLSIHSCYALALFYGVKLVNRGEVDGGGSVVTVLFCVVMASSSLSFIAPLIPDFTKATAAAKQIVDVIADSGNNSLSEGKPKDKLDTVQGDIELRDISFSYPERPSVKVLDSISLRIPSHKVTAIVGQSGSGKSTIVSLIEKWYTVAQGEITVDGRNIADLDTPWLRSQIGLVQQEPMLFNDTIYSNVLNGLRGDAFVELPESKKRELVIEACKQANAHGFIEQLPKGYKTPAGERAGLLSGGQRQRIAIARSIIANPKILLLDEATSALDSESERAVSAALEKPSRGRTTVMIAHKLSTVAKADNIVVFSHGKIIEQGTHSELLERGGYYCSLLQAQGHEFDDGEHPREDKNGSANDMSRRKPRESAIADMDQVEAKEASPLEAKEISRRHSIFWCIYQVYLAHPSFIWPTIPSVIAALIAGATFPLQAFFFSRLTTIFEYQGSKLSSQGNLYALLFFILGLVTLACYLLLLANTSYMGAKIGRFYRHVYLKSMLEQDIGFFQAAGNSSGGLTALLAADSVDFVMLFTMNAGIIIAFTFTLVSCAVLAIAVYWKLGLVGVFGCLPLILSAGILRVRLDVSAQDRCAAAFLECARYSTEAVAAIRTVSSLTMESKVEELYHQRLQAAATKSSKKTFATMSLYPFSDSLTLAAGGLVFWYGGRLISYGEMSNKQFFLIFAAVLFGGTTAGVMFGFASSVNRAHAAMNRIFYLLNSKPAINSSTGLDPTSLPPSPSTPAIQFQNVTFHYPSRPSIPVLRNLSLTIPRGSHVCLVGPSGCGKSTLISLLERFYDLPLPPSGHSPGEIRINGHPIAAWDIHKLRQTMGLVAQDTTLYHGTIRSNVLLGLDESRLAPEHVTQRMETACRQADIHDFVASLPEGYETDVGARGVALSGGQRQRLALARCLVRDPQVLLLDEATSALDSESERAVRGALGRARGEREGLTIVSVTHQVESMKDADRIFVVDRGVVVEEGEWGDLMGSKGRLWGMVVQGEVQGQVG